MYDTKKAGDIARLVTPPYDVIPPEAQREYHAKSQYNIIRLELGLEIEGDGDVENKYTRAAASFAQWIQSGVLKAEDSPAMYVYEQEFTYHGARRVRRGLLVALLLEEWSKGIVLPHEETLPKPLADRLNLMRACNANLSPVFGLYEDDAGTAAGLVESRTGFLPDVGVLDEDGDAHRLWVVTDGAVLRRLYLALLNSRVFIADGHHRYLTALRYRDEMRARRPELTGDEAFNFVMMLLVSLDDPGLVVLPTHRKICGLGLSDLSRLESDLAHFFEIDHVPLDAAALEDEVAALLARMQRLQTVRQSFAACGLRPGSLSLLRLRVDVDLDAVMPAHRSRHWRALDVSVLHALVVNRVLDQLGLSAPDENLVSFTRDAVRAVRSVLEGSCALALLLNAPTVAQVKDVALAGDTMPQKSTYFYPKPLTGMVISPLTGDLLAP